MKKLLVIVVLFVGLLSVLIVTFAKPSFRITIEGTFNPATDIVLLNNKKLNPEGEEGKFFKAKGNIGKNLITIKGPFITAESAESTASFFASQSISVPTTDVSAEGIISSVFPDNSEMLVSQARIFKQAKALVAFISYENDDIDDSHPSLIIYDSGTGLWKDDTERYVSNRQTYELDDEVRRYFGELSSD